MSTEGVGLDGRAAGEVAAADAAGVARAAEILRRGGLVAFPT